MEYLINILILLPLCILFSSAVLSLGLAQKRNVNWLVGLYGQIGALSINTISIFILKSEFNYNSIQVNKGDLIFIEFILIFGIIIFFSIQTNLKITHSADLACPNYLMFLATIISLFISENLLVITIAYILVMVSLGGLYFYGPYKKQINTMNRYFIIVGISSGFLLFANLGTYLLIGDLRFDIVAQSYIYLVPFFQYLLFSGYFFGFGLICGVFPILNFHLKDFFQQANPIAFRSMVVILNPVSGLILVRMLSFLLQGNQILTTISFLIAFLGILLTGIQAFRSILGSKNPQYRSIFPIIGSLSIIEYHIFILLGSNSQIVSSVDLPVLSYNLLIFYILIVTSKSLLIESFSPVFDLVTEFTLKNLGGFRKYFPQFLFFIIFVPLLYTCPFLPGYLFIEDLLSIVPSILITKPIQTTQLWMSACLILGYLGLSLLTIAVMMNEVFFGTSRYTQSEILPKISRKYYYPPLFVCGIMIFFILWLNWGKSIPDFFFS